MRWIIEPHVGVGPLRFGMTRTEARATVARPCTAFQKGDGPREPTDAFDELLLHVHYDNDARCVFIEFGGGVLRPIFQGNDLLTRPFRGALAWFRRLDPGVELDCGLSSRALGIGLYAPAADEEPMRPAEGVAVFPRGYYDAN